MKKLLTVFLVLILTLGGLFLWKGGHHALFLAQAMEEWLDADDADQALTLQIQRPDFAADVAGVMQPQVRQWSFSVDTFWTDHLDRTLWGLTTQGMTVYTDGRILYLDTGKSYSLPVLSEQERAVRNLAAGLLLHGRVTKNGDTYRIAMDTDELELHAFLTADRTFRTGTATAVLPDDTVISVSLEAKPTMPHPIPQPVLDAMVLSAIQPPIPLTEPLELLLPALDNLLPLHGSLTLQVECGILNLSETAQLRMDGEKAELVRKNTTLTLPLPEGFSQADPAALSLLLLRNGTFTRDQNTGQFELTLPSGSTNELCSALVPQLADLGIRFTGSQATVTLADGAITSVLLTADGEVPFLITTIPVTFRSELQIQN